jgi:autotransporter-associated beta strand protein
MDFGTFTASVSGTGAITVSSGYTLSNGTLDVSLPLFVIQGGANTLTTISNTLTTKINAGGAVRLQSNSGAMTANGAINLNGGNLILFANNATNAVTVNGAINVLVPSTISVQSPANGPVVHNGNLTGSAALAINNTTGDVARVLQLAGNNSGYSGTITFGGTAGRATRLTSATAGSSNATWNVSTGHTLQVAGVSVDLGTLTGAGSVASSTGTATINVGSGTFAGVLQNGTGTLGLTKVGTGTLTLSGVNTYTGITQVNAGTLFTTPAQTGATTVNVADGATLGLNLATLGTTFNSTSLNTGTATGATLLINNSALANPTTAPFTTGTFTPTASTTIRVVGTGLSAANGIPLIDYTTIGGLGFVGVNVALPPRAVGTLVDNVGATRVDLNLTSIDYPRWNGDVSGVWDVDPTGAGVVGTANWKEVTSGNTTRFLQGTGGIDSALFNDSATGTTSVSLATTLTPTLTTVNNSTLTYTFGGAGKTKRQRCLT